MSDPIPLKPIGVLNSLLYFGIPGAIFAAAILGLLPAMVRSGFPPFLVFVVTFVGPLVLMLGAAMAAYRLEGRSWSWAPFRDRLRLGSFTKTDWGWTLGLVLGTYALQYAIGPIAGWVEGVRFYDAPKEFGDFMGGMRRADFGFDLKGRWDVWLFFVFGSLIFNVGGEELWWRGIILPRQELVFGRSAWLVNGLLWNLFHFFYHTNLASVVAYLPMTLPLAYVAQRTRSTWPGIIAHFIGNIGLPIGILYRVLGLSLPGGG